MRTAAGAALLFLAAAALAQSPAPPQKPEPATEPRKPSLNLKLDEADLRSLSRSAPEPRDPPAERSADTLPSLGGDARSIGGGARPADRPSSNRPFPQDSENAHR